MSDWAIDILTSETVKTIDIDVEKDRIVTKVSCWYTRHLSIFLQNFVVLHLSGGRYNILIQKYEFGPEDFLAYIGGYLVRN